MKTKPFYLPCFAVSMLFLIACMVIYQPAYAQNKRLEQKQNKASGFDPDRLFFGGNLGLQFGTITIIDVSPLAGYKITDRLAAGIGITYQYYNDKRFTPAFSTSIYGGRVFSRFTVIENLFAHVEYEVLNYDALFVDPYGYFNKDRVTANNFYVGGGYRQSIGGKAALEILILYNLNESAQSLYQNPIMRMGISVGL